MKSRQYFGFGIIPHALILIYPTATYQLSTLFVDDTYSVDSGAVPAESNDHSRRYIAGIAVACVGSLMLFLLVCLCAWRRRRMQDNRRHQSHRDILEEGEKGIETRDTIHGDRQSQGGLAAIDCYDE